MRAEQAKYGTPKPLICSEGGPDVSLFHGSFFSFADPVLSGDWSRGADQLARMYLSCIASGVERFFLYSVHNDNRYGRPIHMAVEPGFLLRPMHLTVAALAYFVEGASYEKCLKPSYDISAHVFRQTNPRPYADVPSTVVVLIANGEEPEDLPNLLQKRFTVLTVGAIRLVFLPKRPGVLFILCQLMKRSRSCSMRLKVNLMDYFQSKRTDLMSKHL